MLKRKKGKEKGQVTIFLDFSSPHQSILRISTFLPPTDFKIDPN
jgi:hypothetical protein